MNRFIVAVGSNIDPAENVERARRRLAEDLNLVKESPFIRTAPQGLVDQPDFLNGAFLVETEMDTAELETYLKRVENDLGRVRGENKNGPRTIDLDIVARNGEIVSDDYERYDFVRVSVDVLM